MILVTGGTGLVGSHLLYKLICSGQQVRAIYRNEHKFAHVKRVFGYYTDHADQLFNNIAWVKADITDVPALIDAFKNVTYVYHCAANLSFQDMDYQQSRVTNVTGTANIVNLCLSEGVKKLCYISSIATLGEKEKGLITEETPWIAENNKYNVYAITKYHAEMEVWRGIQEGLQAVIVNPGVILGPGFWDNNTGDLFTKVHHGFRYYTTGSVGIIDVNDVTDLMILLLQSEIKNERFILVSENISYQNLIQTLNDSFEYQKKIIPLQKWQLNFIYYLEKLKYLVVKGKPNLSKANITSSFKNLEYDNAKIKIILDFNFTPIEKCIQRCSTLFLKDIT